jgi:drug/metabolite transporter (DMT)-like permease
MSKFRGDLIPSIAVATAAAMWGLFWIPVHGIENAGVNAYWTGAVIFAASTIVFLPILISRFGIFLQNWRSLLLPGCLAGTAFALYILSLNLTDVVRAILLFYMSPLWSTLFGILILKERLTINRVIALMMAFGGLYLVLALDDLIPVPQNTGDWFALASGLLWSIASVKLFQGGATFLIEKVTIFVVFALIASLVLIAWQQGGLHHMPDLQVISAGWYWIAIIAVSMFPICYCTVWPASVLSPGRVGMLLMGEVIVGVISAAILTDEPFGHREFWGTVLIVGAGVVEVLRQQTPSSKT